MICKECLDRIAELERLERIHHDLRRVRHATSLGTSQRITDALAIQQRDAQIDKLICKLELMRHQRHHVLARALVADTINRCSDWRLPSEPRNLPPNDTAAR